MTAFLFLALLLTSKNATIAIGGIIILAKVWEKIRPVVIARSENGKAFHFGVSHSTKRKNMMPLTQDGIEGLEVEEDTCYGLCNKPSDVKAEIGTITPEKAKQMIESLPPKKRARIEKRR
ncbi:MAG: hypothetical protein IPM82_10375 [Saprospiraceae bacterium]|nr:hypothetical protein [Saprospiraceae bacterium]